MTKRILHIDDETAITDVCKLFAERTLGMTHTYETSKNADELVPRLTQAKQENRPYDAVILDDSTEGKIRGLDALANARLAGYDTPIIVHASVRDKSEEEINAYVKGLRAYFVPKPNIMNAMKKLNEILTSESQGGTGDGSFPRSY